MNKHLSFVSIAMLMLMTIVFMPLLGVLGFVNFLYRRNLIKCLKKKKPISIFFQKEKITCNCLGH